MAEGCNLFLSHKDLDDIESALKGSELAVCLAKIPDQLRSDVQAVLYQASTQRLLPILVNPQHPAYPTLQQKLAVAVGGRDKMTDQEYERLPRALYVVLGDHPDAMGIFRPMPSYYGPGASAIQEPYELLAAAALITQSRQTSLGRSLFIDRQDRLDFGWKTAHGFFQPRSYGTIEADIVVQKPGDALGIDTGRVIGIDAKYTRGTIYDSTDGLIRQLEGVRNAFGDRRIHEFYYVTNREFGSTFRNLVEQTNLKLVKDRLREINALHFAPDAPVRITDLTAAELASIPPQRIDPDQLKSYDAAVRALAERCHVPQIGLCERVLFDG